MQEQLLEAMLAALVHKLADGEVELTVDDLLAVEGKTFQLDDIEGGFALKVSDDE